MERMVTRIPGMQKVKLKLSGQATVPEKIFSETK